jgi:hypothetical protein
MKTSVRNLIAIMDLLNPDDFYVITIYDEVIRFQGTYDISKARKARALGFQRNKVVDPIVDYIKDGYNITLTL